MYLKLVTLLVFWAAFFATNHFYLGLHVSLVGLAALGLAALAVYSLSTLLWKEALPNQWMLVVHDGRLVKAGTGIKGYFMPWNNVITFPSVINRVSFSANNITQDYQGIEVMGYGIYSVHRDGDGPLKFYISQQGNCNDIHISSICECLVRQFISNSTIDGMLFKHSQLRDTLVKNLRKRLEGWGIWLETIEITSVTICSEPIFKDKQAEQREEERLKAELFRLESEFQNYKEKTETDFSLYSGNLLNTTRQTIAEYDQNIRRKNAEIEAYKKSITLQMDGLKKTRELKQKDLEKKAIMRQKNFDAWKEKQLINNDFEVGKIRNDLETEKKQLESINMEIFQLESLGRIFNEIKLKEVRFKQYVGPQETGGVVSLLPALGILQQK